MARRGSCLSTVAGGPPCPQSDEKAYWGATVPNVAVEASSVDALPGSGKSWTCKASRGPRRRWSSRASCGPCGAIRRLPSSVDRCLSTSPSECDYSADARESC